MSQPGLVTHFNPLVLTSLGQQAEPSPILTGAERHVPLFLQRITNYDRVALIQCNFIGDSLNEMSQKQQLSRNQTHIITGLKQRSTTRGQLGSTIMVAMRNIWQTY